MRFYCLPSTHRKITRWTFSLCFAIAICSNALADPGRGGGRGRGGGFYVGPANIGIGIGIGIGGYGYPFGVGPSSLRYYGMGVPPSLYYADRYRSPYPGYYGAYGLYDYGMARYRYPDYALPSQPIYNDALSSPRPSYSPPAAYSEYGHSYNPPMPSQPSVKLNPDGTPAGELRPGMILPDGAIVISVGPTSSSPTSASRSTPTPPSPSITPPPPEPIESIPAPEPSPSQP